jgi:sugar phosphate isomerase/epimerase
MAASNGVLALEHLTAIDATPLELVEIAAEVGCAAVCPFLHPMEVLPRLPAYALIGDTAERRALRARCDELGVGIEIAYPFSLTGRTDLAAFAPALESAAYLGARAVNTLVFDREPARRVERFAEFCERAAQYGLDVTVEFFPQSQVRSLTEALDLVGRIGRPGAVGVNLDLLHLHRSGGTYAEVAAAPPGLITYAQLCDGPAMRAEPEWAWEASFDRQPPGEGAFDLPGFLAVLPPQVRLSVEVPQEPATIQGLTAHQRVSRAVEAAQRVLQPRPDARSSMQ